MYTPDAEAKTFIADYMNESQPEALLDIARMTFPEAASARLVDFTGAEFLLELELPDGTSVRGFAWPEPLTRRQDIREHLQTLQWQAQMSPSPTPSPTGIVEWEDLSDHLPDSDGWMHSGIAVDEAGTIFCAHPDGGALIAIEAVVGSRIIPTGFAELHGISCAGAPGVLAVADPGYRALLERGCSPLSASLSV